MGTAGYKNRCAFFLIWGYFIIHRVLFRPWGSLLYQKKALPKKTLCDHPWKIFSFQCHAGHPYYQSPVPSRSPPASLSLCVCHSARWCGLLLIASTIPTVCPTGGLSSTVCSIGYTVARSSDCATLLNIYYYNVYPPRPAATIGKWIPGRITNRLTRLDPVAAPRGQADISRGRSTPDAPAPCTYHIPTPHYILW